ncbi:MAG: autotransporter assembly complex protein TamA [Desulfovibrionales bacterium]
MAPRYGLTSFPPGFFRVLAVLILAALFDVTGVARAQEHGVDSGRGDRPSYSVTFQGIDDDDLEELLRAASDAVAYQDNPPLTVNLLRARAREDIPDIEAALESWGYFKASVAVTVREEKAPTEVVFSIEPGPAFRLASVSIEAAEGSAEKPLPAPSDLDLESGPFRAQQILDARGKILDIVGRRGYPYPKIAAMDVVADHAVNRVSVTYLVDAGPEGRFGEAEIQGLKRVEEQYVRTLLPWEPGDAYDDSKLAQAREKIIKTGLFGAVEIRRAKSLNEEGRLPLTLVLKERKHRTVKAGVNYTSDFGLGVSFGWENRNYFGTGEVANLELEANQITQSLSAGFVKPNFFREDRRLVLRSVLANEDTDAYKSTGIKNTARIERILTDDITLGAGVGYDFLRIEENDSTDNFSLFSFPLSMNVNKVEDPLDPSQGFVFDAGVTPYAELFGEDIRYLKYDLSGSGYLQLIGEKRLIMAGRARYGQILGARTGRVPATERFFAGGGGSVRGYPYQSLSPLDDEDDPIGGQSVVELSGELRLRTSDKTGVVAFLDGGRAYEDDVPNFGEELFWGAGLGFRYFTAIGPIRLDVAVPLDDRQGVSDKFQVYVSIGQAF